MATSGSNSSFFNYTPSNAGNFNSFYNPSGSSNTPSWEDSFKYKPSGGGKYGFGEEAPSSEKKGFDWAGTIGRFAGQALKGYMGGGSGSGGGGGRSYGGGGFSGGVQKVSDNLSAVYPAQFGPYTTEGVQGDPGILPSIIGAAGTIGGALLSDINVKENIDLVGKSPAGINVYQWNYKGNKNRYQGVIAQEVPWASIKNKEGYLMVDYSKVDVDFKSV